MATIHPCSTRELERGHLLLTFGFQQKFFKFSRKLVNPLEFYKLSDNKKYDFNPLCQINFTAKQPAYVHSIPPVDLHWFFEISIRTEKKFQLELKKKISYKLTEKNFQ